LPPLFVNNYENHLRNAAELKAIFPKENINIQHSFLTFDEKYSFQSAYEVAIQQPRITQTIFTIKADMATPRISGSW
jgi:hypothetical protein